MKKLYWRPPGVSRVALVFVASVAVIVLLAVELMPVVRKQSHYAEKIAAARLARAGMDAIRDEKQRLGHIADPMVDPANTGMLGESFTPVTSNTGFLSAKLTSTNPNFAAVIIHLLHEGGVEQGDVVAVGVSGSFPALNVSTYAAIQTIGARPVVIASTSSSEWGANHVDFLWLDMERILIQNKLLMVRSAAASYGGIDDLGVGMTEQGRSILAAAIRRNGVERLAPTSLSDSIDKRMALYDELSGDASIKAYINVGGGSASVGTHVGKKQFKPGLNRELPRSPTIVDSVMSRFARRDVVVVHISRMKLLAKRYGFPYQPRVAVPIGQGSVFINSEYNRWLAFGGLAVVLGLLIAFVRWDVAARLLRGARPADENKAPEHMV